MASTLCIIVILCKAFRPFWIFREFASRAPSMAEDYRPPEGCPVDMFAVLGNVLITLPIKNPSLLLIDSFTLYRRIL